MSIARRDLLGLSAAVAVSLATASCRAATGTAVETSPPPPSRVGAHPAEIQPVWAPQFAGHPPPGRLYYGASLPYYRSLPEWEKELGTTLSVHRSYFTPDPNETAQLVYRCNDDLAHNRLPHVSSKSPSTWRDVASGLHDRWLSDILRRLDSLDGPVFFTLHHEPENDAGPAGLKAADFIAMQRRAIRLAAELAPLVTIVPVVQHWTFDPLNASGDPEAWIVHEATVLGFDVYNPWSPTNGKVWRSLSERVDNVVGWFGDKPIAIGEYGCRNDPADPDMVVEWLADAARCARNRNVISMSYFNSRLNARDGTLELGPGAEREFARLLASGWVHRPR